MLREIGGTDFLAVKPTNHLQAGYAALHRVVLEGKGKGVEHGDYKRCFSSLPAPVPLYLEREALSV